MAFPWTCSICALRCDDVLLQREAQGVAVRPDCALAARRVGRLSSQTQRSATVQGQPVSWAEALDAAIAVVRTANRLSIVGTPPDFQTARAAIDLAVASDAVLDFPSTPTLQALGAAVARDGLTTATLGDVRQHADRVVWIGRPDARLPRLRERFTADLPTLTVLPQGYGGGQGEPQAADQSTEVSTEVSTETLRLETGLVDWLRDVLLQLQDSPAASTSAATSGTAAERLLSFVGEARYLVIMVADDAFPTDDDLQAGSWLLRLVERFGQTGRCVLLMPDASAAARQTLLWRTGFAGPVQFANRIPGLSVAPPRCDAALRLQPSLSADPAAGQLVAAADACGDVPTVLLGDHSTPDAWVESAEVFLPVGWAGVDHAGTTVRGDGTVTLALQGLPDNVLEHRNPHRAADVLANLLNAIAQQERA